MTHPGRSDGGWRAIPQPSSFRPSGGVWAPQRVRVVADATALRREAERIEAELAAAGIEPARSAADPTLRLTLPPATEPAPSPSAVAAAGAEGEALPDESFRIRIADDVTVTAASPAGAFRATRQLLHNLRAQGAVPRGTVVSAPAVAERGLHLDTGRKHYPAEWIVAQLRAAADVGINVVQWHFSENEGFRIESAAFPEIVSAEHITRAEAAEVVATARDLHIELVPSLDMPGHLRHTLAAHPGLRLPEAPGLATDHALDITREDPIRFALALIDDLIPVFPHSSRWNLGGDEFVDFDRMAEFPALATAARERYGPDGTGFDLLTAFVNRVAAHVRAHGLQARAWNDGLLRSAAEHLDPEVVLTWWTNWNAGMRPVADALAAGHRVVNVNDALFYYVLGENAGYRYPTAERIWAADWHPGLFPAQWGPGGQGAVRQELVRPYPALLLGVSFAVWSDRPDAQTPAEVAEGIRAPLRAMAERAWNAGSALSLEEFAAVDTAIGAAPPTARCAEGVRA
ncbi:Beta-N-acetylhexosaminidase precursor [Microbacterium azadirachtae]|uniref:Beta-N-acetylhexosaminidase n=1 Tax=Microbacterium azadirachtae TaxID=582680 RepID=A0A0F0LCW7_9MICO|nr:family 20 glycosylhydrolase [Microbacterium azadirachtae]KJL30524.1 Beta-N-acetylhexosaminidase precursor [Microbacterium azadirachtae]